MRRLMLLGLVFVLALSGCIGSGPTYSLSGRVLDDTDNGIVGATVAITGRTNKVVTTGDEGEWSASGLRGQVTVTPMVEGMNFRPPSYRTASQGASIKFTGSFGGAEPWVVEWVDGYVWGHLDEFVVSPVYQRTYHVKLHFVNNSSQEGVINFQAQIGETKDTVGRTIRIPPGGKHENSYVLARHRSDNLEDHVYEEFYVELEGLIDGEPVRIDLPFTHWNERLRS